MGSRISWAQQQTTLRNEGDVYNQDRVGRMEHEVIPTTTIDVTITIDDTLLALSVTLFRDETSNAVSPGPEIIFTFGFDERDR